MLQPSITPDNDGVIRQPRLISAATSTTFSAQISMTSLKDDTADDRELLSVHVVLLVAISGVLLSSGANVVLRRLGQKWLPPAATSVACGLIVGAFARIHSHLNDSGIPWELGFDGPIFFLLLLPIINFDSGISLRRGPFFRQVRNLGFRHDSHCRNRWSETERLR